MPHAIRRLQLEWSAAIQALKQQISELERANEQLVQFANILAHDLKSPLRHVMGFCRIVQHDYGDRLGERAHRFLDHAEMGRVPYAGTQFVIDGYTAGPHGPAPLLGEHNEVVSRDVLGLDEAEIAELLASDALV